ncbi:hypothetical protein V2S66_00400 [Streptomyces sp. V4-01]|uniref:SRPBCC family protein n=1 Tax=Actinacidiphila polyblastidii TaxID=3110430 RepID=A0ABU7P5N8_9ACTN|nr:hypothetical protein [Streptomyces sp. V4-01]
MVNIQIVSQHPPRGIWRGLRDKEVRSVAGERVVTWTGLIDPHDVAPGLRFTIPPTPGVRDGDLDVAFSYRDGGPVASDAIRRLADDPDAPDGANPWASLTFEVSGELRDAVVMTVTQRAAGLFVPSDSPQVDTEE